MSLEDDDSNSLELKLLSDQFLEGYNQMYNNHVKKFEKVLQSTATAHRESEDALRQKKKEFEQLQEQHRQLQESERASQQQMKELDQELKRVKKLHEGIVRAVADCNHRIESTGSKRQDFIEKHGALFSTGFLEQFNSASEDVDRLVTIILPLTSRDAAPTPGPGSECKDTALTPRLGSEGTDRGDTAPAPGLGSEGTGRGDTALTPGPVFSDEEFFNIVVNV